MAHAETENMAKISIKTARSEIGAKFVITVRIPDKLYGTKVVSHPANLSTNLPLLKLGSKRRFD